MYLLSASLLLAQQSDGTDQKDPQGFKFGVKVDQVFLSVSAVRSSDEGGFVRGLTRDNFRIYEDGVEQEIVNFSSDSVPARIALLIDASGSTRYSQGAIQAAAMRFASSLTEEDRIAIVTFSHQSKLILNWSNDLERIENRLKSVWPKGRTVLNDALYVTYDDLFKDVPGKKAVIVLTDGVDSGSMVGPRDVLTLAERSEVTAYVVSLLNEYRQAAAARRLDLEAHFKSVPLELQDEYIRQSEAFLSRLARNTGGRMFNAAAAALLTNIYAELAAEIKNQYYLSYTPSNKRKEGKWRSIQIEVVNRLDVKARTRPGYFEESAAVESGSGSTHR